MTESNPTSPRRRRSALLAGLLALTVSAGVAAKITPETTPSPDPVAGAAGPVQASVQLDRTSVLEGSDGLVRMELTLRGADLAQGDRPELPTDLVVVLDRSGSMRGEPLRFAKSAVRELIAQLGDDDRFGLVSYSSGGQVSIPLQTASPSARESWSRTLQEISANGGTNMSHGLDLAHGLLDARTAGRAPRVVLLSDGHANQGDHSLAGLQQRASRAVSGEYVLSSVGVGDGFDETVMSAVADAGTGNFYYLADLHALAGIFTDEFASARETVASSLVVSWPRDGAAHVESAAGYPLEQHGDATFFRPGGLFSGQERKIWLTLRVPTGRAEHVSLPPLRVAYVDLGGEKHGIALDALRVACVEAEDDYYASFDADVYKRGYLSESVGALKESVAQKLRSGSREDAVAEVETHMREMELVQLRALGYVLPEAKAKLAPLQDDLNAPAAAEPAAQNRLGKKWLEAGRDERRSGSKR